MAGYRPKVLVSHSVILAAAKQLRPARSGSLADRLSRRSQEPDATDAYPNTADHQNG
jgi:hypothetical protein